MMEIQLDLAMELVIVMPSALMTLSSLEVMQILSIGIPPLILQVENMVLVVPKWISGRQIAKMLS